MLERLRGRLAEVWGVSGVDVDRVALTLALVEPEGGIPEGVQRVDPRHQPELPCSPDVLDGPFEAALFTELISAAQVDAPLPALVGRGMAMLESTLARCGDDPMALLAVLSPSASSPERSFIGGVEIELGRTADGEPVRWTVNRESGTQNNPNLRLAGMPGTGKSQFLLHILAAIATRSQAGFLLFDYKGDLASNRAFVDATRAETISAGAQAVPLNPFQLPEGTLDRLAPRLFAGVFASAAPAIGEVQKQRLTKAFDQALSAGSPSLDEVGKAIREVYQREGAKPDTVTGLVDQLVSLGIFADRGPSGEELLRKRWIIDLSKLQDPELQQLVAFVLLQHVQNTTQALPDAPFDRSTKTRTLRGIIAVDEAHYYLERRCGPLLQLIRTGRSKGVPVFLSSQSLNDFLHETELNEFLPNTWLFKHGMHPSAKLMQGALGLSRASASAAAERINQLEQFHVLGPADAAGGAESMRTHPFFEGRFR